MKIVIIDKLLEVGKFIKEGIINKKEIQKEMRKNGKESDKKN